MYITGDPVNRRQHAEHEKKPQTATKKKISLWPARGDMASDRLFLTDAVAKMFTAPANKHQLQCNLYLQTVCICFSVGKDK